MFSKVKLYYRRIYLDVSDDEVFIIFKIKRKGRYCGSEEDLFFFFVEIWKGGIDNFVIIFD